MPLPEVAVSALLLQDRVSNENGPDSGFYYWLCSGHSIGPNQLAEVACSYSGI